MEMVWSSNFHFKQFLGQTRRERERERERARARGRRGSPNHAVDVVGEPRAPVRRSDAPDLADRTTHRAARSRLWSRLRAISPSNHRSLSVILIFVVVVVVWWWCFGGCGCRSLLPWVFIGVSVVCGVGIWLWFVPWIKIWLWFWNLFGCWENSWENVKNL